MFIYENVDYPSEDIIFEGSLSEAVRYAKKLVFEGYEHVAVYLNNNCIYKVGD